MSEAKMTPLIEDKISSKLSGDALRSALDLVAYMRANAMPPDPADYHWFKFSNENICVIMLGETWEIFWADCDVSSGEHEDCLVDEGLIAFAQAHVNPCATGHCDSSPGKRKTIFGKVYNNLCTSSMSFENPDSEAMGYIKKLAEIRKRSIGDCHA